MSDQRRHDPPGSDMLGGMAPTPSTMLSLGTTLPTFRLPDLDGHEVSSDDSRTAPGVVVAFICPHCPFVKHMRQEFAAFAKEYAIAGWRSSASCRTIPVRILKTVRRA